MPALSRTRHPSFQYDALRNSTPRMCVVNT